MGAVARPAAPAYRPPPPIATRRSSSRASPSSRSEGRRIAPVVILVIAAIALAIVVAALVGTARRRRSDPAGLTGPGKTTGSALGAIEAEVIDFDPEGDGGGTFGGGRPRGRRRPGDRVDHRGLQRPHLDPQVGRGPPFRPRWVARGKRCRGRFDADGYSFEIRASDSDGSSADDFEVIESFDRGRSRDEGGGRPQGPLLARLHHRPPRRGGHRLHRRGHVPWSLRDRSTTESSSGWLWRATTKPSPRCSRGTKTASSRSPLRMTGSRADALDATQEAFILAFRRASSFRGEAAFSTWLYRIAINACKDFLRKRAREATHRLVRRSRPRKPTHTSP